MVRGLSYGKAPAPWLKGLVNFLGDDSGRQPNRDFWVDDYGIRSCYECGVLFNFVNRKHHCRVCGRVFCGKCSFVASSSPSNDGDNPTEEGPGADNLAVDERTRVCHHCHHFNTKPQERTNPVDVRAALPPAIEASAPPPPPNVPNSDPLLAPTLWPIAEVSRRGNVPRNPSPTALTVQTTGGHGLRRLSPNAPYSQAPLPESTDPTCAEGLSVVGEPGPRALQPGELLSSSIGSPRESNLSPTRKAPFPHGTGPDSSVATSASAAVAGPKPGGAYRAPDAPSLWAPDSSERGEAAKREPTKRPRRLLAIPGGMKKLLADMQIDWAVPPPVERAMDAEELLPVKPVADMLASPLPCQSPQTQQVPSQDQDTCTSWYAGTEAMTGAFAQTAKEHTAAIAQQLLASEGFDASGEWLPVVQRLAFDAVAAISPQTVGDFGHFDVCFYAKVMCLSGVGQPCGSSVVRGVAAWKNPATRNMPTSVENPRVMLLSGAVEYQRTQNRLCSLETLVQQEKEHLRNSVLRIAQHKPNVLMVERTVARMALEMLADMGICVVLSCSLELLTTMARCTGAEIAPSVEQLTSRCIATCKAFKAIRPYKSHHHKRPAQPYQQSQTPPATKRVVSFFAPNPPQPPVDPCLGRPDTGLVIFEDCPRHTGSTILLQGGTEEELERIKRVVQFLCFAISHAARECSLLASLTLATMPPLRDAGGNQLPLVDLGDLQRAPGAVERMAELTRAAQGSNPILNVSPYVVPTLGGQVVQGLQYRDLAAGPLPIVLPSGDAHHTLQQQQQRYEAGNWQHQRPPAPYAMVHNPGHRSMKSYCGAGDVREELEQRYLSAFPSHQRSVSHQLVETSQGATSHHQRSWSHTHLPEWPSAPLHTKPPRPEAAVAVPAAVPPELMPPWAAGDLPAEVLYTWQRLYINVSSMHPDKAMQCVSPEVKRVDFYTASDMSLSKYVNMLNNKSSTGRTTKLCSLLPSERCPCCGESPREHLFTLLHGVGRVTVAAKRLPAASALPDGNSQRLWLWSKPGGVAPKPQFAAGRCEKGSQGSGGGNTAVATAGHQDSDSRRVPLCMEAASMSLSQFLCLAFGGLHLTAQDGTPLWEHRVLYLGMGRTVVAFHTERLKPQVLQLPPLQLSYVGEEQNRWLSREVADLMDTAAMAFESLQELLMANSGMDSGMELLLAGMRRSAGEFCEELSSWLQQVQGGPGSELPLLGRVSRINMLRKDLVFKILEWASLLQEPLAHRVKLEGGGVTIYSPSREGNSSGSSGGQQQGEQHSGPSNSTTAPSNTLIKARDLLERMAALDPSSQDPNGHRRAHSITGNGMQFRRQLIENYIPYDEPSSVTMPTKLRHRRTASADQVPDILTSPLNEVGESGEDSPWMLRHVRSWLERSGSVSGLISPDARSPGSRSLDDSQADIAGNLEGSAPVRTPPSSPSPGSSTDSSPFSIRRPTWAAGTEPAVPLSKAVLVRETARSAMRRVSEAGAEDPPSLFVPTTAGLDLLHVSSSDLAGTGRVMSSHSLAELGRQPSALSAESSRNSTVDAEDLSAIAQAAGAGGLHDGGASPPTTAPHHERPGSMSNGRPSPQHHQGGGGGQQPGGAGCRVSLNGRCWLPPGQDDTILSIFDDEPTSVVAFLLQSQKYHKWLQDVEARMQRSTSAGQAKQSEAQHLATQPGASATAVHQRKQSAGHLPPLKESAQESQAASETEGETVVAAASPESEVPPCPAAKAPEKLHPLGLARTPSHSRSNSIVNAILGTVVGGGGMQPGCTDFEEEPWQSDQEWQTMLSLDPLHYNDTLTDNIQPGHLSKTASFSVVAYFAPQFAQLRRHVLRGDEGAFVASLSRCRTWQSSGGKSNAYFAKTRDDRFVVKQMSKVEKQSFLEFGPAYFRYLAECMHKGRSTCLAKILGVYEITIRGSASAGGGGKGGKSGEGQTRVIDVLVMENIFYGRSISRIYDLKGSLRHRYNAAAAKGNPSSVLLDENLLESMIDHPLCVDSNTSAQLEAALWSDTAFLSSLGVMDYSLLVGVDHSKSTLVVGIIDFIRQYTLDKQFETLLKSSGLLGGAGQQPTVVSPRQYMRRFRSAMSSYFTVMPDSDPQHAARLNPDS
eukprot:CAMPEP_0117653904 /NCGR_PEP_ID=MMETSP0804-20121206/3450_1 /TAXON_ID=1074897 /ORGANISM="Tetraselmis astigmatica, Strain CCMP880" /LENGTH=2102 /DNA_ID=CAMNT_0005460131 /DNA_START=192 /DNA_END=6500 /DNA_ORIENTATION=+